MTDKLGMERKVWLLPSDMAADIAAYQIRHRITSEVEAARRLLTTGILCHDPHRPDGRFCEG